MMEHLGKVEEKDNGRLTFTVDGVSQVFHRSQGKDVSEVEQILDLRRFLESVGLGKDGEGDTASNLQLLVVINQQEALVFRSEHKDSIPERLHPYDPHDVLHHANHTIGGDLASKLPENATYYEAIAETLAEAEQVLLMGNGTGSSCAMDHFREFLSTHHQEVADKVVGALTLDIEALTEAQLLQEARAFFAGRNSEHAPRTA